MHVVINACIKNRKLFFFRIRKSEILKKYIPVSIYLPRKHFPTKRKKIQIGVREKKGKPSDKINGGELCPNSTNFPYAMNSQIFIFFTH